MSNNTMTPEIKQLQHKLIIFYQQKQKYKKDKLLKDAYNVTLDKLDREMQKLPFPWD